MQPSSGLLAARLPLPRRSAIRARTAAPESLELASARLLAQLTGQPLQEGPVPTLDRQGSVSGKLLHGYRTGLESQYYEYDYYVEEGWVDGVIPSDLHGTLFTIGPGLAEIFGQAVRNMDDGDGMVASIAFDGGSPQRLFVRNKFVRTMSFAAEQMAGRRLSRGMHDKGSGLDGLWSPLNLLDLTFRSAANSAVLLWAGKLLALSEYALPYELNKLSLDAVGEHDLHGHLAATKKLSGNYRIAPAPAGSMNSSNGSSSNGSSSKRHGGRAIFMSSAQSGIDAALKFIELDEAGDVVAVTTHRVRNTPARLLTDFLVTDSHFVVLQPPVSFNAERFATRYTVGEVSFAECIDFDGGRPSRLHVIPRAGGAFSAPKPSAGRKHHEPASTSAWETSRTLQSIGGSLPVPVPRIAPGPVVLDGTATAIVVDAPPLVSFSAVNAFYVSQDGIPAASAAAAIASGAGRYLVADFVAQEGLPFFRDVSNLTPGYFKGQPKPELTRLVVDLQSRSLAGARTLCQRTAESFVINPLGVGKAHRYVYSAASAYDGGLEWGPPQVVARHQVAPEFAVPFDVEAAPAEVRQRLRLRSGMATEVWAPGDHYFIASPPTFVPKSGAGAGAASGGAAEDNGWLLVLLHNSLTNLTELAVLDAARVTSGPVAVVRLPHRLPYAKRAHFSPSYCGPARVAPKDWRPALPAAGNGNGGDSRKLLKGSGKPQALPDQP